MRPTVTKSYMNVTLKPTRKSLFIVVRKLIPNTKILDWMARSAKTCFSVYSVF
jgi:hypothetical protein